MNKGIGIILVISSIYFLIDALFVGAGKTFTLHAAVMHIFRGFYFLFAGYAGILLIATSFTRK